MEPWLSLVDLTYYIGEDKFPDSFRTDKLRPMVREVIDSWLSDLLTQDQVSTYFTFLNTYGEQVRTLYVSPVDEFTPDLPFAVSQYTTSVALIKFMCYATWAVYLTNGDAINTDTGVVKKFRDQSESLSSAEKTRMINYYQGFASRYALELAGLLRADNSCTPSLLASGRPSIRKAQRSSPSRLGN